MAHCYNCGCDISEEDRTRLCDDCKKIILPFVKFMDASSSSAVRRLISNEENLRNAGVTDGGMEYLLRLCELHDRSMVQSEEDTGDEVGSEDVGEIEETEEYEDEEADDIVQPEEDTDDWSDGEDDDENELREIFDDEDDDIVVRHKPTAVHEEPAKEPQYSDIEVPLDTQLRLIRKGYGTYLTAAEIVLGIVAALLVVWFLIDLIAWSTVDFAAIAGAITAGVMVYVTDTVRKFVYDIEEVKKHFR